MSQFTGHNVLCILIKQAVSRALIYYTYYRSQSLYSFDKSLQALIYYRSQSLYSFVGINLLFLPKFVSEDSRGTKHITHILYDNKKE